MAITTTVLGNLAMKFHYDTSEVDAGIWSNATSLLGTINTWITNAIRGWTLDEAKSGTGYSTYWAYNFGASGSVNPGDKKYCRIDFTQATKLYLGVSEFGNFAVPADNVAYNSFYNVSGCDWYQDTYTPGYQQRTAFGSSYGGDVYLYVSPRWLLCTTYQNSSWGDQRTNGFSGCVEVSRDNELDTYTRPEGNIPPSSWLCGKMGSMMDFNGGAFSFVRCLDGSTSLSRSNTLFTTKLGCGGMDYNTSYERAFVYAMQYRNIWDQSKIPVSEIVVGRGVTDSLLLIDMRGRLFGLKITLKDYSTWNRIVTVDCDSDYFPVAWDDTGTITKHAVLCSTSVPGLRYLIPINTPA